MDLIERLPYAPADEYEKENNMKEFISKEKLIERNNEFLYIMDHIDYWRKNK
ncbi:hypothetical protein ACFSGI_00030 [Paenibacillus nicotianae]|uniref:Uncharacterized protein n=1 Tax=Paenibacillus nicotianae TaxID=1526551 RepID=A0ABW4ULG3_9BACL